MEGTVAPEVAVVYFRGCGWVFRAVFLWVSRSAADRRAGTGLRFFRRVCYRAGAAGGGALRAGGEFVLCLAGAAAGGCDGAGRCDRDSVWGEYADDLCVCLSHHGA